MRRLFLPMAMSCVLAVCASAADKPPTVPRKAPVASPKAPVTPPKAVDRIDSLIATKSGNLIVIQARGAVGSGGWRAPTLKQIRSGPSEQRTIVLQFLAVPPPPTQAVIVGLVPIAAKTTLRLRKGTTSVKAVAGNNEITTQITLK
jgi:hypothetical protein